MTAQDKILYVANKLGLTSLKDMQASFNVSPSMYLQGDMSGSGIYASNYTLSGYEVPGL